MNTSMTCSYSAHLSGRIKHVATGLLLSLIHTRGHCSSLRNALPESVIKLLTVRVFPLVKTSGYLLKVFIFELN